MIYIYNINKYKYYTERLTESHRACGHPPRFEGISGVGVPPDDDGGRVDVAVPLGPDDRHLCKG